MTERERDQKIFECCASLTQAIQDAGGDVSSVLARYKSLTLLEFIFGVAATNNIRFVFVPQEAKNTDKENI